MGTRKTSAWETFLHHLDQYVERTGTAAVPQLHVDSDGFPLVTRSHYWRKKKRDLTDTQIAEVESRPGWVWTLAAVHQQQRRDRLRKLAKSSVGQRLAKADYLFVSRLRSQLEQLPLQEQELVVQLVGSVPYSSVHAFAENARRWLSRNPSCDVTGISRRSKIDIDGEDVHLGRQRAYVRERYWMTDPPGQKLTQEEIGEVESLPGWVWRASRGEQ